MDIDKHIAEITRLRSEADALPDDVPQALMEKIRLLALCMVYVGRLSSFLDGEYKRIYAERKRVHAQAYIDAPRQREAHAELAVVELRLEEAKAYEAMRRWRNALDSLTEEIHALKMKMRIDFAEWMVTENVPVPPRSETQS